MKKFAKIVSVALVTLMIASVCVSCKSMEENAAEEAAAAINAAASEFSDAVKSLGN